MHSKAFLIGGWILRVTAAAILLQTLYFKFTGARESVYIFTTIGQTLGLGFMEPWGRVGTGVFELLAAICLLMPGTVLIGALLSMAVISGAIFFHLTILGISLPAVDDHGELFALALIVFACSVALAAMYRQESPLATQVISAALVTKR